MELRADGCESLLPAGGWTAESLLDAVATRSRIEVTGGSATARLELLALVHRAAVDAVVIEGGALVDGGEAPLRSLRRSLPDLDLAGDVFAIADRVRTVVGDRLLIVAEVHDADARTRAVLGALPGDVRVLASRATGASDRIHDALTLPVEAWRGAPESTPAFGGRTPAAAGRAALALDRLGGDAAALVVRLAVLPPPSRPVEVEGADRELARALHELGALTDRWGRLAVAEPVWFRAARTWLTAEGLDAVVADALEEVADPVERAITWLGLGRRNAAEVAARAALDAGEDGAAVALVLARAGGRSWPDHAARALVVLGTEGRYDEVLAAARDLALPSDRAPELPSAAWIQIALAAYLDHDGALLDRALARGHAAGPSLAEEGDLAAIVLKQRAWVDGDPRGALAAATAIGDRLAAADARSDLFDVARADALALVGDPRAEPSYLAVLERVADPDEPGARMALSGLASSLLLDGRGTAQRSRLAEAAARCEATGALGWSTQFARFLLTGDLLDGGPSDAVVVAIDEAARRPATDAQHSYLLALVALAAIWRDRPDDAARTFLARPRLTGDATGTATWGWVAAEWHLHRGRLLDVEAAARYAASDGGGWFPTATVAELLARWARFERGADQPSLPAPSTFGFAAGAASEAAAIAALAAGDHEAAASGFEVAADEWAPVGRVHQVRALDGLALALGRAGREAEASEARRRADALAGALSITGARPVRRMDERAPSDGHRLPAIPATGAVPGLTPSEGAVMALVSEGLTSAQIARARGVRRSTVESQVAAARSKLGGQRRRRAASAAQGIRRGTVEVWVVEDRTLDLAAAAARVHGDSPLVRLDELALGSVAPRGAVAIGSVRHRADADRVRWCVLAGVDAVLRPTESVVLEEALAGLGEDAWVRALRSSPTQVEALCVIDRRLLSLLAGGETIDVAASQLELSPRSAHRRLATVRGVLGVSSTRAAVAQFRSTAR